MHMDELILVGKFSSIFIFPFTMTDFVCIILFAM